MPALLTHMSLLSSSAAVSRHPMLRIMVSIFDILFLTMILEPGLIMLFILLMFTHMTVL